jgi:hypothetical protein
VNAQAAAGESASERTCALAAAAFLVVAPVSSSPGLRMALLVVAALALGHAAFHHGRDRLAPAPPAFVAIPLALWAALATASLAWSVNPAYTLSELRPEIVYAALAFGVFHFAADARRVRLWSAALLAGLLALCALLAALGLAHARNLARPATRLAGAIGLALLAGFVAKNLTDDFFNRHNALVFWALNGMLIGLGSRAESSS